MIVILCLYKWSHSLYGAWPPGNALKLTFHFIRPSFCLALAWSHPYHSTQDLLSLFYILKNWGLSLKWTWEVSPQRGYSYIIESLKQQTQQQKCCPLFWASQEVSPLFQSVLSLNCFHSSKLANICYPPVNEDHSIKNWIHPRLEFRTALSHSNIMQTTHHFKCCNSHNGKKKVERDK